MALPMTNKIEEGIIKKMVRSYLIDLLLDGRVYEVTKALKLLMELVEHAWDESINDAMLVTLSYSPQGRKVSMKLRTIDLSE
jgi:hypothetical protein